MAVYVLAADAALELIAEERALPEEHRWLAPAVLRSDVVAGLYSAVRGGDLSDRDAVERLDRLRGLGLRLLGDRVLQRTAFQVARELDLPDLGEAEYLALTKLHGDALVVADRGRARSASVPVVALDELLSDRWPVRRRPAAPGLGS